MELFFQKHTVSRRLYRIKSLMYLHTTADFDRRRWLEYLSCVGRTNANTHLFGWRESALVESDQPRPG